MREGWIKRNHTRVRLENVNVTKVKEVQELEASFRKEKDHLKRPWHGKLLFTTNAARFPSGDISLLFPVRPNATVSFIHKVADKV